MINVKENIDKYSILFYSTCLAIDRYEVDSSVHLSSVPLYSVVPSSPLQLLLTLLFCAQKGTIRKVCRALFITLQDTIEMLSKNDHYCGLYTIC